MVVFIFWTICWHTCCVYRDKFFTFRKDLLLFDLTYILIQEKYLYKFHEHFHFSFVELIQITTLCVCVCVCVCVYKLCVCVCVYAYMCMDTSILPCGCVHACMNVCALVCDYVCASAYISLEKKIWNRVDCQHSPKKIQNTQGNQIMLLTWTKQDKTCKFLRKSSFFKLYTTEKQTVNSTYLVSDIRRLEEGKGHETDWRDKKKRVWCDFSLSRQSVLCPFPSTISEHLTDTREVELFVFLFFCGM